MRVRRHHLIAAAASAVAVAVGAVLPASSASADPVSGLPDADLFCGSAFAHKVDAFVARPPAATVWVQDATYGGHYEIVDQVHYVTPGLLYAPVLDPTTLQLIEPPKSFGQKTGTGSSTIYCEVVSRFVASNRTVVAPVTLALVP